MRSRPIFLSKCFEFQSTLNRPKLREFIIAHIFNHIANIYIATLARKRKPWNVDIETLSKMNYNTMGFHLFQFLNQHQFKLQYKAENHDVFHIISGCLPNVKEEIGLQFLLLGNGKRSYFLYLALIAGIFILPDYLQYYKNAYLRGKSMRPFHHWEFEHLLNEDFDAILQFINHQNTIFNLYL